LHKPLTFTPKP